MKQNKGRRSGQGRTQQQGPHGSCGGSPHTVAGHHHHHAVSEEKSTPQSDYQPTSNKSVGWSQLDFSQMEEQEGGGGGSVLPPTTSAISRVCQSIAEDDLELGLDEEKAAVPECHPDGSGEFGLLAEQVEKRMAVHTRGSKTSDATTTPRNSTLSNQSE